MTIKIPLSAEARRELRMGRPVTVEAADGLEVELDPSDEFNTDLVIES